MGGSEIPGRELVARWKGHPQGQDNGSFHSTVFASFSLSLMASSFLCLCLCSVFPGTLPLPSQGPRLPPGSVHISAATWLRGDGLGAPRLPQLTKGGIPVLNARAHPLGVELAWEVGGQGRGQEWSPGDLWALPSAPTPTLGSQGPHLSRSCSGWCGHTSGKPLPRSHP